MEKRLIMKTMNMAVLPKSGRDFKSVITCLLMLGTALTDFRGLITLRILKALRLTDFASMSIILQCVNSS